jgi:hypothetical protein
MCGMCMLQMSMYRGGRRSRPMLGMYSGTPNLNQELVAYGHMDNACV